MYFTENHYERMKDNARIHGISIQSVKMIEEAAEAINALYYRHGTHEEAIQKTVEELTDFEITAREVLYLLGDDIDYKTTPIPVNEAIPEKQRFAVLMNPLIESLTSVIQNAAKSVLSNDNSLNDIYMIHGALCYAVQFREGIMKHSGKEYDVAGIIEYKTERQQERNNCA